MAQEASWELKEVGGNDSNLGHQALSLDGDGEHVLANTCQVNNKDHVVDLGEAGNEFNLNFSGFIALKTAFVVNKFEFLV